MAFELRGISVRHAVAAQADVPYALQDISLSLAQGEQVALIGPSGAGKTTLLHTLACARQAVSGEFTAFAASPWSMSHEQRHALRARLFLAPQSPPLPPRQRVVTAVLAGRLPRWTFWQAIASLIRPREAGAAHAALARFNLQDKLYARVDRLSGGERQRCGMARLLLSSADAFLVDEPLSALDPILSTQMLAVLKQEAQTRNATLVCSLHQIELALAHFPRIIALREGRIVFDLPSAQVTAEMIAALYQNEHSTPPVVVEKAPFCMGTPC